MFGRLSLSQKVPLEEAENKKKFNIRHILFFILTTYEVCPKNILPALVVSKKCYLPKYFLVKIIMKLEMKRVYIKYRFIGMEINQMKVWEKLYYKNRQG